MLIDTEIEFAKQYYEALLDSSLNITLGELYDLLYRTCPPNIDISEDIEQIKAIRDETLINGFLKKVDQFCKNYINDVELLEENRNLLNGINFSIDLGFDNKIIDIYNKEVEKIKNKGHSHLLYKTVELYGNLYVEIKEQKISEFLTSSINHFLDAIKQDEIKDRGLVKDLIKYFTKTSELTLDLQPLPCEDNIGVFALYDQKTRNILLPLSDQSIKFKKEYFGRDELSFLPTLAHELMHKFSQETVDEKIFPVSMQFYVNYFDDYNSKAIELMQGVMSSVEAPYYYKQANEYISQGKPGMALFILTEETIPNFVGNYYLVAPTAVNDRIITNLLSLNKNNNTEIIKALGALISFYSQQLKKVGIQSAVINAFDQEKVIATIQKVIGAKYIEPSSLLTLTQRISDDTDYADEDVDKMLELSLNRKENIYLVTTAVSAIPEQMTKSLQEFINTQDKKYAIIPIYDKEKNHFTLLYITKKEDKTYEIIYVDPRGKNDPLFSEDKVNDIKECLATLEVKDKIQISETKIQLYTNYDSNNHCGAYIVFLLQQLQDGFIKLNSNNRLEIDLGNNHWKELDDLLIENSKILGQKIRYHHLFLLKNLENDANPLEFLISIVSKDNLQYAQACKEEGSEINKPREQFIQEVESDLKIQTDKLVDQKEILRKERSQERQTQRDPSKRKKLKEQEGEEREKPKENFK
jgi:hypothetical protein